MKNFISKTSVKIILKMNILTNLNFENHKFRFKDMEVLDEK